MALARVRCANLVFIGYGERISLGQTLSSLLALKRTGQLWAARCSSLGDFYIFSIKLYSPLQYPDCSQSLLSNRGELTRRSEPLPGKRSDVRGCRIPVPGKRKFFGIKEKRSLGDAAGQASSKSSNRRLYEAHRLIWPGVEKGPSIRTVARFKTRPIGLTKMVNINSPQQTDRQSGK
jgi:hypothetical protein